MAPSRRASSLAGPLALALVVAALLPAHSHAAQVQGISAIISTPSSIQEVLLGVTPPGFINLVGPILGGNAQPQPQSASSITNLLQVPAGSTPEQRAGSAAAGGVVAASLLTASGICVTVTGGLGTAYAALSEALGLVTGTAGKINLAMEYAKAGLTLHEDIAAARSDLSTAFIESGALPEVLQRAAQVRAALTTNLVPQLQSLRNKLTAVRANLATLSSVATIAQGLSG